MQTLITLVRNVEDVELSRAWHLSDVDTWNGPRADVVREELRRLRLILRQVIELAERSQRDGEHLGSETFFEEM